MTPKVKIRINGREHSLNEADARRALDTLRDYFSDPHAVIMRDIKSREVVEKLQVGTILSRNVHVGIITS